MAEYIAKGDHHFHSLCWPVDINRLKKLKWRPINPVSIEIWISIQLLHFIEYIQQYFSYVVAVSYIGGGNRRKPPTYHGSQVTDKLSHIVVDPTTITSRPQGLAVIFSCHQVCVKRRREDTFLLPKVKVEFWHLFSLQKRFSLSYFRNINANIVVFC
jgi:hypothetical protein